MYYEVRDAADELLERVDYQYEVERNHIGNPTYIVRRVVDPQGPDAFYATTLQYNQAGELWFIGQQTWPEGDCFSRELLSLHEFRASGRAMRMTRERDPNRPSEPLAGTTVWHDYDGDAIYGDVDILGVSGSPPQFVTAETFSHEPGVGQFDVEQTSLAFYHGDQIGSLRAITGDPSGSGGTGVPPVIGRLIYTAFGEPVYSGSVGVPPAPGGVGTRYQYAGAWGYQSGLYDAAGPHGAGSPGGFTSAVPFLHVGHRWYDPSTGRFLQRDPIGIEGGLNAYYYVEGNPLSNIDPLGLTWLSSMGGGFQSAGTVFQTAGCAGVLILPGQTKLLGAGAAAIGTVGKGIGIGMCWIDKTYFPPPPPPRPPSPPYIRTGPPIVFPQRRPKPLTSSLPVDDMSDRQ